MKEIQARVISNKAVQKGFHIISLDMGRMNEDVLPGHFAMIGGDFGDGILLRRPYSIFDATLKETETVLRFFYKVVGRGTKSLSSVPRGATLNVLAPLGKGFEYKNINSRRSLIIVMGGIGVAPFYLFMKHIKKYNAGKVLVFYGARNKKELFFMDFFSQKADRVYVSTDDGSRGYKGFVSDLLREKLDRSKELKDIKPDDMIICTCGPREMMRGVSDICKERSIDCFASMEEVMGCGMGACLSCVVKSAHDDANLTVCHDGPVFKSDAIVI